MSDLKLSPGDPLHPKVAPDVETGNSKPVATMDVSGGGVIPEVSVLPLEEHFEPGSTVSNTAAVETSTEEPYSSGSRHIDETTSSIRERAGIVVRDHRYNPLYIETHSSDPLDDQDWSTDPETKPEQKPNK